MPPGKRESETPDADDALGSAAAAEAAAAEAEARAEAARARAEELRRKLEAAGGTETETDSDVDADADLDDDDETAAVPAPARKHRLRLPSVKAVAASLVVLVIAGLLGATGYMLWEHKKAADERHRTAEYAAAARQGVVNLMSMDYNQAKESVQRVIDDSVGKLQNNFKDSSEDLIKALQDSKMITKVTVNDAAVEQMDDETAVVLVAATSHREGPNAPKEDQQPRVWRVVVTLERDGGQIKMSDVEFS
jgi:Mce-associated membrane protein